MKHVAPKRQRCAIYTRKSTEHNLDLAFNSLDAQREACEAYIKSQAHEGWTLIRNHFDDGGLSGASLDRAALQDLLNLVRARRVDIIVVYKVDRLTRSLADFARLIELFDEHEVSFVSVTQSFNTTSSMGRLTLNVLLSFAQFEREVIGERVRDKIAASKRRGIWVGGPVPLGYRSVDKKLRIVPDDAAIVRRIFADYLSFGSIGALAAHLDAAGVRPKPKCADRAATRAPRFSVGGLFYLLKNRIYVGEIVYRGEFHKGEHEPLLDRGLFEAVQQRLRDQATSRSNIRRSSRSLLAGKIFDDRANPMTPTHASKKGVRYRYYCSQALLQGRKGNVGSVARVSAPDIEALALNALRTETAACAAALGQMKASEGAIGEHSDRELIDRFLRKVIVRPTEISLMIRVENAGDDDDSAAGDEVDAVRILTIPFHPPMAPRKGIARTPASGRTVDDAARLALLRAIGRAKTWIEAIMAGRADFATIATKENLGERYVRQLAALACLSPRIVEAIMAGQIPAGLNVAHLARGLPLSWLEQERRLRLKPAI